MPTLPADNPPADSADALATTLHVKSWLVTLLLFMLLGELALFFCYRYCENWQPRVVDLIEYCTGLIEFFGICGAILLMVDLLVAINITLAGRLAGAASLVRALIWSTIAALLLFPWQAFLANEQFTHYDFKIPGVLYTWPELIARARWKTDATDLPQSMLLWARFVGFPVAAMIILAAVQFHCARSRTKPPAVQ